MSTNTTTAPTSGTSNRRPLAVLAMCGVIAVAGFVVAGVFDQQKGWNHPGQATANVAWILMLLAILGFVVTASVLVIRRFLGRDHNRTGP